MAPTHGGSKADRRAALLSPYARDNEASVSRAMDRGRMPRTLDALVAWVMDCEANEVPTELHRPGTWFGQQERDRRTGDERWPGELTGGSLLGSPADGGMRRVLATVDEAQRGDEDGYYLTPLRAALSRLRRRWSVPANDIETLIRAGGDWRMLAERRNLHEQVMALYMGEALRKLWMEHSDRMVRLG